MLTYEVSGCPVSDSRVPLDAYKLAVAAGREFDFTDVLTKEVSRRVAIESIDSMEHVLRVADAALNAARDPDVAVSSSNPHQPVYPPKGNEMERMGIRNQAATAAARLAKSRSLIYQCVLARHYALKFSGAAEDVFTRTRLRVDRIVAAAVPEAARRLTSVYDSLRSTNPEDWSNAAHSCRRVLKDLADMVFPPPQTSLTS